MTIPTGDRRRGAIIVALLMTVPVQGLVLPLMGFATVRQFPQTEWMLAPALVWSFLVILCMQALLLITLRLFATSREGRLLHPGVKRWMVAMMGIAALGVGLLVFAHLQLSALRTYPPLVAIAIMGLIGAGVLLIGRLLRP